MRIGISVDEAEGLTVDMSEGKPEASVRLRLQLSGRCPVKERRPVTNHVEDVRLTCNDVSAT